MAKDTSPRCTGTLVSAPGLDCPGRVKRAVYVMAPATPNDPTIRFQRGISADDGDGVLRACTHCFRVYKVLEMEVDPQSEEEDEHRG